MSESKVPCSWCLNGRRKTWAPGGHVVLFVCVREHMKALPLCEQCAADAGRRFPFFICKECAAAGQDEDDAVCMIDLVTTREDWMRRINEGSVRLCRGSAVQS